VATKKGRTKNFFPSPLLLLLFDPGWIKIGIRDNIPDPQHFQKVFLPYYYTNIVVPTGNFFVVVHLLKPAIFRRRVTNSEWFPESGLGPGSGGLGAVAASGPQLDVQGSDSQSLKCKQAFIFFELIATKHFLNYCTLI
jgi:hypothetical protein